MAATFGKYPSLDKQWRKMMFSFYPYLSTKNRNATQEEWKIRRLIWDFKDGKAFSNVAHLVANKLIQLYGTETKNIIFACVPASSAEKNEKSEGGNLAASKIRNLECPNYEICLIDYGCGKFNRKIHIMEQYP